MKYKIYDNDLKCYAFNGEIFNTKKEAVEELVYFFSIDCWKELTKIRAEIWKYGNIFEMYIKPLKECE